MPTSAARALFDKLNAALAEGDWEAVGLVLDPADVASFRDRELAVLVDRAAIVAQARREGREVTNWSSQAVLDPERLSEFGSEVQAPFPGAPTLTELASLQPLEFLLACAGACAAGMERLSKLVRARGLAEEHSQEVEREYHVIGELAEGPDLVHILYRSHRPADQDHPTDVDVRTLRLVGPEWRVCLDHELSMLLSPMFAFHALEEPFDPVFDADS